MNKSLKQSLMACIIIAGFIMAVADCYGNLCNRMNAYQYVTFLFQPWDRFMDFFTLNEIHFDPYLHTQVVCRNCFPFLYMISSGLLMLGPDLAFDVFNLVFAAALLVISWRYLKGGSSVCDTLRDVLIFTCLSYPVIYCFDRGNMEAWQFVLLYLFLLSFSRKKYYTAAVVLGAILACKPFPVVFLILFVNERKFLAAFVAGGTALFLTGVSLLLFTGGFSYNLHTWLGELAKYQHGYVIQDMGFRFGHSLFGLLKYVYYDFSATVSEDGVALLAKVYFPIAGVLCLAAWVYLELYRNVLLTWEKWAILMFCATALPFVSGDYTLINYLIPIYLFINAPPTTRERDAVVAVLFALLMVPKDYFHWIQRAPEVNIGSVVNPLIQMAIVAVIVCRRYSERAPVSVGVEEGAAPLESPRVAGAASKKKKKAKRGSQFHPVR